MALNATAASLLGFLLGGPRTGWDLAHDVRRGIGNFWNVTQSQIYRELRTLEQHRLVTAAPSKVRVRRPFAITDAGREAFRAWLALPPGEELIRFPLLLTVYFREHLDPPRLGRSLREHQLLHQRRLDAYESIAASIPAKEKQSGPGLTLQFGLEYERMVLRWFDAMFAQRSPARRRKR